MKHKYVIIDSSKENHNSVDAKFKVQIPQGITGTTRVCVKSFSMPNSYHNIYGDLKTAKFVEFYRSKYLVTSSPQHMFNNYTGGSLGPCLLPDRENSFSTVVNGIGYLSESVEYAL